MKRMFLCYVGLILVLSTCGCKARGVATPPTVSSYTANIVVNDSTDMPCRTLDSSPTVTMGDYVFWCTIGLFAGLFAVAVIYIAKSSHAYKKLLLKLMRTERIQATRTRFLKKIKQAGKNKERIKEAKRLRKIVCREVPRKPKDILDIGTGIPYYLAKRAEVIYRAYALHTSIFLLCNICAIMFSISSFILSILTEQKPEESIIAFLAIFFVVIIIYVRPQRRSSKYLHGWRKLHHELLSVLYEKYKLVGGRKSIAELLEELRIIEDDFTADDDIQ